MSFDSAFEYEGEIPLRDLDGRVAGSLKTQASSGVVWLTAKTTSGRGQGLVTIDLLQPSEVAELIGMLRMAQEANHLATHRTGGPS